MRIKQALKYHMYDKKTSLLIFYFVIYAIFILLSYIETKSTGNVSFGGMDTASAIFIFVMALASMKETLMLFLQNGISRRSFFITSLITIAIVAVLMAIIDHINSLIFINFINYQNTFMQIYHSSLHGSMIIAVLWSFSFYLMTALFGFFIACLYFRMNKWQKITVSIGVPVFFFIILPILFSIFPSLAIYGAPLAKLLQFALGVQPGNYSPINFVISTLLVGTVLSFISFLLIKKAPAKE